MTNIDTTTEAPATDRNPTVEAWIESFGVNAWDFRIVQLDDIDKKASHANQARIKPVDEMTVNRYGLAAAAGAKFPPVVLAQVGNRLVTIDGNHRVSGLPLGGVHEHPAYIIDAPDAVVSLMTTTANTMNGLPFTEDEQRRLAIDLYRVRKLNQDEVALLTGLSVAQVGTITRAADARDRASDKKAARRITDGEMELLSRLNSDEALDLLVGVQLGSARLAYKRLRDAVASANKQRSDPARIRVIEDAVAVAKGAKASPSKQRSDAHKFSLSLGTILNCNPTAVALSVTSRQDLLDKIEAALDRLAEISEALS